MIWDDVDDEADACQPKRCHKAAQPGFASEFRIHRRGVNDVVTV